MAPRRPWLRARTGGPRARRAPGGSGGGRVVRWAAAALAALSVSLGAVPSWRARQRVAGPRGQGGLRGRHTLVPSAIAALGLVAATAGPVLAFVTCLACVAGGRWWRRRMAADRHRLGARAVARGCEVIEA